MSVRKILLLLLISASTILSAEELKPGVLYQPGTILTVSDIGLQVKVPEQWQALLPAGTDTMVMESAGKVARIVVSAVPQSTDQMIRTAMTQSTQVDASSTLVPVAKVTLCDGIYRQQFQLQGMNPQNLVGTALARLGSNATAVYVLMLEPEGQGMVEKVGDKFIKSIRFSKLKQASNTAANKSADKTIDWNQQLRGRTLKYLKTGNGLSVDKRMNLCSNGQFFYSDQDSYISSDAISDFSSVGHSNQAGSWQIKGNQLQLKWNDGSKSQFKLSRRYVKKWGEWGTFVDDQRWFNVSNKVCQ